MKKKVCTSPGGRIGLTADELIDLGHSSFEKLAAKPDPLVYVYRVSNMPESLSAAEIAASSRKRLSPEPEV